MWKMLVLSVIVISLTFGSWSKAAKPDDVGLKEGDLISAIFSDDPDVYIVNEHGYKRLFLNPEIFNFYGHLGGFFNVKLVTQEVRDSFVTSGLFRDCESNDEKVYGVDIDGEDTGQLRWINTTGKQAVSDDPGFFKKVFCINQKEFKWYPRGTNLNTVKDVPRYDRMKEIAKIATKEKLEAKAELKDVGQVVICHYPPGNITAYQTLTVGASALKAHLDHGDTVGPCPVVASPSPTPIVSISPSPTASPSYSPTPTPTPTLTPTPTPTPSPTQTPTPSILPSLIQENFNSYASGSVVGQYGWFNRANGLPWVVENTVVQEGAKAIYNNNTGADSVITKNNGGNKLADGKQSFYIRTQNRSSWDTRATNFQLGIYQGSWDGPSRATLGFEKDGSVNYVNGSNDARVNFATYIDDAWNLVEIEWRSSDARARYRINSGTWTSWIPFTGGASFTGFDTVGFVTWYLGTGGVYIDNLN